MRFWDTSALVPLLLEQEATPWAVRLFEADADMVVWWGTAVECASALARLRREDILSVLQEKQTLTLLDELQAGWTEILPSDDVRRQGMRLLRLHGLRAADALQLAAARLWAGDEPAGELVTLDERLARAALLEGFEVPVLR